MKESDEVLSQKRKKRVQKIKRMIICIYFLFIMIPSIFCLIFIYKLNHLETELLLLKQQVESISNKEQKLSNEFTTSQEGISANSDAEDKTASIIPDQSSLEKEESNTASHKVYLTFDDGPSIYTDDILDILNEYQVKATFFVVGKDTDEAKDAYKRIVEEGHTLGMHSYSHVYNQIYASTDAFEQDFLKLQDFLYDVTGVRSTFYRFPGGSSNTVSKIDMREFIKLLDDQDITYFDWNISSKDASNTELSVDTIVDNCISSISKQKESVILMHDSAEKKTTVEALPIIIEDILAMDDTVILPITQDTVPVQHITLEQQETEEQ